MTIQYLEWDSEVLGVSSGLIDLTNRSGDGDDGQLAMEVNNLLRRDENFNFVTIKVSSDHIETINLLIKNGCTLIDTALTFAFVVNHSEDRIHSDSFSFEFVNRVESKLFLALADDMSLSRFYKDRRIGYIRANKLWKRSIEDHCRGFADELLVAYYESEPCGLITIAFSKDNEINLHIVGVLEKRRGKKIARMMLGEVVKRHRNRYRIFVETQSTNTRAQHIYRSSGFVFHHLTYTLHWWGNKNGKIS